MEKPNKFVVLFAVVVVLALLLLIFLREQVFLPEPLNAEDISDEMRACSVHSDCVYQDVVGCTEIAVNKQHHYRSKSTPVCFTGISTVPACVNGLCVMIDKRDIMLADKIQGKKLIMVRSPGFVIGKDAEELFIEDIPEFVIKQKTSIDVFYVINNLLSDKQNFMIVLECPEGLEARTFPKWEIPGGEFDILKMVVSSALPNTYTCKLSVLTEANEPYAEEEFFIKVE